MRWLLTDAASFEGKRMELGVKIHGDQLRECDLSDSKTMMEIAE